MRRVYQLAALAVALIVGARSATAAAPERTRSPSSVTSLSVVPAAGRWTWVASASSTSPTKRRPA